MRRKFVLLAPRRVLQGENFSANNKRHNVVNENIEVHDVSPTTVDFDGNGIPDFLGGAEDGRFYFLNNPRAK